MGLHPSQLTLVLNGHRPMRVLQVLEVLEHVGARPARVFELLYPLGGVSEALLREKTPPGERSAGATAWVEVVREAELWRGEPVPPGAAVERLRGILKREIVEAGLTQREVSRRHLRGADALGHALRGDTELTFFHVFAVLEATAQTMGRMFAEVFALVPPSPVEELHLASLLDELEAHHRFLAERLFKKPEQVAPDTGSKRTSLKPQSRSGPGPKSGGRAKARTKR